MNLRHFIVITAWVVAGWVEAEEYFLSWCLELYLLPKGKQIYLQNLFFKEIWSFISNFWVILWLSMSVRFPAVSQVCHFLRCFAVVPLQILGRGVSQEKLESQENTEFPASILSRVSLKQWSSLVDRELYFSSCVSIRVEQETELEKNCTVMVGSVFGGLL